MDVVVDVAILFGEFAVDVDVVAMFSAPLDFRRRSNLKVIFLVLPGLMDS